jgi:predicted flap endonuclease-1-like 5' DNA nuclease
VPPARTAAATTVDDGTASTRVETTPVAGTDAPAVPVADTPVAETGAADDFRRIQGIGPKMAAALQAAGIRTYHQLAELDEATLRETIRAAGLRGAPGLTTWPQQAKVLAGAATEADRVLPAAAVSNGDA